MALLDQARMFAYALPLTLLLALPAHAAALDQKLLASDGEENDHMGVSAAVDGDTAVIGAPQADGEMGAVYVFERSGDSWVETAKLTLSDRIPGDELGFSVAIGGDTIVAGAPMRDV